MNRRLRNYHAARWDEPLIHAIGGPGQRGQHFPLADADGLVPDGLARTTPPDLPEVAEPQVLSHYLRLSQETMGMIGISLFGTCTMKYNPRAGEQAARALAGLHPQQAPETLQGLLACVHGMDLALRSLSGMDRFSFQPAGGADAAWTQAIITRAFHAARGEASVRTKIITSLQSPPCNPATAATAGYEVITLPLGAAGYPSLDALIAAIGEGHDVAALMINNPDDMGVYNPEIGEWVRRVKAAGALAFYDHANFNGVMTKIRARDLGFDACMFMLHKTFGVAKGGGGPAVGAYGCSAELAPFLPGPLVVENGGGYALEQPAHAPAKVREYLGNLHQVVKAWAWLRAMGAHGLAAASDLSVLFNNYMETRLLALRGVTRSHPQQTLPRLEMTRYSLGSLFEDTGISAVEVQNRMADFGIDAFWLSHEPWIVPQPFTPETGEMWSKAEVDEWIDVLAHVIDEAYADPQIVRSAPHRQVVGPLAAIDLDDPANGATTIAAWRRRNPGYRWPGEPGA